MLPVVQHGNSGPLVVMLHWLGGSARTWDQISLQLAASGMRAVALDLPGFGDASTRKTFSPKSSAAEVIETIQRLRASELEVPWLLAGHSMGGKLAGIVARAALDGAEGLDNLRGLVLISPSPPGPEPMKDSKRKELLESLGSSTRNAKKDREHAGAFIDDNTGKLPLAEDIRSTAIEDVLRIDRDALSAWLTGGSNEDWAARIGILPIPAIVLAGSEDADLGAEAQRRFTLPHFASGTLVKLEGGGHLAPLERPTEVADRIATFALQLGFELHPVQSELNENCRGLIASELTSPQTRVVMNSRLRASEATEAITLNQEELFILRAITRRVIPDAPFDLAARVNDWLAASPHDGWRFDSLPDDLEAWRRGLTSFDEAARSEYGVPFPALDSTRQDDLLSRASDGKLGKVPLAPFSIGEGSNTFDSHQMHCWFEDVRGELAKMYMADPRTMQRIGFTGFADEAGFTQIRLGEQETFEI